jgi:DNA polymerase-3 subunit beta
MIVTQYLLSEAARRLRKVAVSKSLPAFSHVRCTRDALGTHFTASDGDRHLTISIPSRIGTSELSRKLASMTLEREQGDFLVPAETFVQVAKAADKETQVTITDQGFSYVTGGIEAFTAAATDVPLADFPIMPSVTWGKSVDADPFHKAVEEGSSHASTDATRYALNGMLYSEGGDAVATDGRRLYHRSGLPPIKADAIIPTDTCKLVESGMSLSFSTTDKDETRFLRLEKTSSLIVRLTSKLVDGTFPNWKGVLPTQDTTCIVRVDPAELAATLRKASITNPKDHKVTLRVSPGQLSLVGERGSFKVAAAVEGKIEQILFNADYLLDLLDIGLGRMAFIGETYPGSFTSSAKEGRRVILMPMRGESPEPKTTNTEKVTKLKKELKA